MWLLSFKQVSGNGCEVGETDHAGSLRTTKVPKETPEGMAWGAFRVYLVGQLSRLLWLNLLCLFTSPWGFIQCSATFNIRESLRELRCPKLGGVVCAFASAYSFGTPFGVGGKTTICTYIYLSIYNAGREETRSSKLSLDHGHAEAPQGRHRAPR